MKLGIASGFTSTLAGIEHSAFRLGDGECLY